MDEIKVESATSTPVSREQEWFIPMMDWTGSGDYWGVGFMTRTREEAETQIRNSAPDVKQGRIARVMLPCKVIP